MRICSLRTAGENQYCDVLLRTAVGGKHLYRIGTVQQQQQQQPAIGARQEQSKENHTIPRKISSVSIKSHQKHPQHTSPLRQCLLNLCDTSPECSPMIALNERGVTVKECDVADAIQNIHCVVKERQHASMQAQTQQIPTDWRTVSRNLFVDLGLCPQPSTSSCMWTRLQYDAKLVRQLKHIDSLSLREVE
jgi:hypothetical protein